MQAKKTEREEIISQIDLNIKLFKNYPHNQGDIKKNQQVNRLHFHQGYHSCSSEFLRLYPTCILILITEHDIFSTLPPKHYSAVNI